MIRRAEEKDLDRIVEINNQTSWFKKETKEIFSQFLDNPLFLVSERKGLVSGYALVCNQDYDLEMDYFHYVKRNFKNFYYVDEVASDILSPVKGTALNLYRYLFSLSENDPIFAVISLKPLNEKSLNFHTKRGFKQLHKFVYPNSEQYGLYMLWR